MRQERRDQVRQACIQILVGWIQHIYVETPLPLLLTESTKKSGADPREKMKYE